MFKTVIKIIFIEHEVKQLYKMFLKAINEKQ